MGAPFETWDKVVDGVYYAGVGMEGIWLVISIALCILACVIGHRHESSANSD